MQTKTGSAKSTATGRQNNKPSWTAPPFNLPILPLAPRRAERGIAMGLAVLANTLRHQGDAVRPPILFSTPFNYPT
ncbi:hypothetical protein PspLS_09209 [Pyricularia sp. CBS 133598]|nr:hypothetical protein PspLS_09209 [Pyricularia sp. CBS 133598]